MSRVVIGHSQGKPIYRDEGPNKARLGGPDPQNVGTDQSEAHKPWRTIGLPGQRPFTPWRKIEP